MSFSAKKKNAWPTRRFSSGSRTWSGSWIGFWRGGGRLCLRTSPQQARLRYFQNRFGAILLHMTPPELLDVDPRSLHVPPSRLSGADPYKHQQQIARFGTRTDRMPPLGSIEDQSEPS